MAELASKKRIRAGHKASTTTDADLGGFPRFPRKPPLLYFIIIFNYIEEETHCADADLDRFPRKPPLLHYIIIFNYIEEETQMRI